MSRSDNLRWIGCCLLMVSAMLVIGSCALIIMAAAG